MDELSTGAIAKVYFSLIFGFTVVSFPIAYVFAYMRTIPGHTHYAPPEKRVWRVMTRGDLYSWIYFSLYLPTCITVFAVLSFYGFINLEAGGTGSILTPIIFFAGLFGGYIIIYRVDKKY